MFLENSEFSAMQQMSYRTAFYCYLMLLFAAHAIHAQKGFLNIACGTRSNFRDKKGIIWVPDTDFINIGKPHNLPHNVSPVYYFQNLRSFPKPLNKSCYQIPVFPSVHYLLRLSFINNHINSAVVWPSLFKYSVETQDILYQSDYLDGSYYEYEHILVTMGRILYICLNRISNGGGGDPFISSIQLIQLRQGMYTRARPGLLLKLQARLDVSGNVQMFSIRYPDDDFDRIWYPTDFGEANISTSREVSAASTSDFPPSIVLQTAQLFGPYNLTLGPFKPPTGEVLFLFYFAQLKDRKGSISFHISINGIRIKDNLTLFPCYTAFEVPILLQNTNSTYDFSLEAPDGSATVPLNAMEAYSAIYTQQRTAEEDVKVLNNLKRRFGFNFISWISDPCFVVPWQHINCTSTRVSHLYLSGKRLTGPIPENIALLTGLRYLDLSNNKLEGPLPDLSKLTMLQTIDVSNNNLKGKLPGWLCNLKHLRELFVQNNNFTGEIPKKLEQLPFANFSRNLHLYRGSKKPSKTIVAAIVGGVAFLILVTAIIVFFSKKDRAKKKSRKTKSWSSLLIPDSARCRPFTVDEMISATQDFSHEIGHGGFGSVFYGKLPQGEEVAVKVLSAFSSQGKNEFLNEILILSRLNHKSLVKLLGYCNESDELMLVYEYMSHGSLKDQVSDTTTSPVELSWKERLQIALDAACGLEYLHFECKPRIFHRDLKSANILLDKNLNAKLSDLGLSREIMDEVSHVTTTVKGTAGYLDPEYFNTHMLTEKSDIYSFGVVLLEMVCGRAPIDPKLDEHRVNLIRWVTPYVEREDPEELRLIIDWRLKGKFGSIKSIAIVCRLALRCVRMDPPTRPDAREVVTVLRKAMKAEDEAQAEAEAQSLHSSAPTNLDSATSSYSHSFNRTPPFENTQHV